MITVPPPPYVSAHGLLKDRSVLITAAAGGGIGFAAAQRCAEEGARALFISDILPRRLDEAVATLKKDHPDSDVPGSIHNVAVEHEVQALIEDATAKLGGLHGRVNHLGLHGQGM